MGIDMARLWALPLGLMASHDRTSCVVGSRISFESCALWRAFMV